jgi:hypothetical protein
MREHIKKQINENEEKRIAYNLQAESITINKNLNSGEQSRKTVEEFFHRIILTNYKNKTVRKIECKLNDFICLVSNLYYTKISRVLAVPLGNNAYKADSFPSRFVIDIIRILHEHHYIEIRKGFKAKFEKDSRVTRIWKTDKLQSELYSDISKNKKIYHIVENSNLIILRDDTKQKKPIKFRNTKYTNQLRKEISFINEINRRFIVECYSQKQPVGLTTDLHAVFNNGSFEDGGRFYTGYHGYQSCKREERKTITINGCATVELDYSGLHPHLLYAKVGIQAEGDQYSVVHSDPALRPVLKTALLALLNASSEKEMVRAGNYNLFKDRNIYMLMKEYKISMKDILEMFKSVHKPISQYFCSGHGVKLMNIDSEIAKMVLLKFSEINEPCLCIHDSFIVRNENKNMLKDIMIESYTKIIKEKFSNKKDFFCKVKSA